MGPRRWRRGDVVDLRGFPQVQDGLQWGHAGGGVETPRLHPNRITERSFNGATPVEAWRPKRRPRYMRWPPPSFNGATPVEAWRRTVIRHSLEGGFVASMGPRRWRRGDSKLRQVSDSGGELQWGHAGGGVETKVDIYPLPRGTQLQWGHAGGGVETATARMNIVLEAGASMGPRRWRRGDIEAAIRMAEAGMLQWGHAGGGVETTLEVAVPNGIAELQWGHAGGGVETTAC